MVFMGKSPVGEVRWPETNAPLSPGPQKPTEKPQFRRQDACLNCHVAYASLGVPGMLVRSVFPGPDGTPMRELGDYITDDRSPVEQRWGGWYVTGRTGSIRHMGNAIVTAPRPRLFDGKTWN